MILASPALLLGASRQQYRHRRRKALPIRFTSTSHISYRPAGMTSAAAAPRFSKRYPAATELLATLQCGPYVVGEADCLYLYGPSDLRY